MLGWAIPHLSYGPRDWTIAPPIPLPVGESFSFGRGSIRAVNAYPSTLIVWNWPPVGSGYV